VAARKIGFDGWVLDPDSGDLERAGTRTRLQEHPLQVLMELIESRGDVVTRERLISRLWPKGVVDFDTGLNTAIRKLRVALGDTADTPRYIETLPRRGYRFLAALDTRPAPPSSHAPGLATPSLPVDAPAGSGDDWPASALKATTAPHPFAITSAQVRRSGIGLFVVVTLALAYFLADKFWLSRRVATDSRITAATTAAGDKSIAVLPFVDMSETKDQEYFSDGMSEELINLLAKLPDLRVPARTSAFYFKGKQVAVADIARALSVAYVLEGSVRTSGKAVRVSAQLIRADNGFHIWSETYDRQLDDIFKIQDEIANSVVLALIGSLHAEATPGSSLGNAKPLAGATVYPTPAARPVTGVALGETAGSSIVGLGLTQNSDAYTSYLQARSWYQRGTKDDPASGKTDYEAAARYLKQALRADPSFAAAWAEVAKVRVRQVMAGALTAREASEEAHHSAERALALNPQLAAVYVSIGSVYWVFDWNWQAAETAFKKAIELEPGNADAFRWAARAASTLGHFDEALIRVRKAIDLDPLEVLNYKMLGDVYYRTGRYEESEGAWSTGRALNPAYLRGESSAHALTLLARGEAASGLAALARVKRSNWDNWYNAIAFFMLGRREESDTALARFEALEISDSAVDIAEIHASRGEVAQALDWLGRAYEQRDERLAFIKGDPFLRNLDGDARYGSFLRKMKLLE
jgi:TolB-like protein/DNA-binding winged helix-turn-helix (wHTH) protein/Tfp pilus assembly protein PilF